MSSIPFDLVLESYPTELCKIMDKYGSDKSPTRNWHSYTPIYHCLFQKKRLDQIRLLEIGLGFTELMRGGQPYTPGASILGWRDYFPHADVYGIDIRPELLFQSDRVKTFLCDQGCRESLQDLVPGKIPGPLDVIIDDGSHKPEHQIVSLVTLFPYLKSGGVYIIEDIHEAFLFRRSPFSVQNRAEFHPLWHQVVEHREFEYVKTAMARAYECTLSNPRYKNNFDDHLIIFFKK